MIFSQSVQWWEEWQLRFLVLGSLFFQYFLFAAALLRKRRIHHWFRSLIWLAYQAGDVLAIYALATLFNRHKDDDYYGNAHLDTLWAPILLLHLGGQDGITAYSIEDNENWRRHFLVAASQITIAVYVFRKTWWLQDGRLLRAAILLFVPGVLKCLEKPWALKNATVTSIMSSSDSRLEATLDLDDEVAKKNVVSLDDYVKQAREHFVNHPLELFEDDLADEPYHLFVDLDHPYAIRLKNLQLVAPPRRSGPAAAADGEEQLTFYREVHNLLRSSLSRAFDRLYTKHLASFGGLLRAAVVLAAFLDIAVLQKRQQRREYDRADVVVTYVLLACTAALELVSACIVLGSGLPWPDDRFSQYNLIGYLARNKKHRGIRRLALMAGYKEHLDTIWCTAPPEPTLRVTKLVHDHVAGGWNDDGMGTVEAYRRFNDGRGQRTLKREGCGGLAMAASLRMPFDESVLVWHLATEFCYFDHVNADVDATRHGRMVSNYMAYLLAVKPEMLVPGARPGLFRAAYEELKKMLDEKPSAEDDVVLLEKKPMSSPPKARSEMARRIIQKVKSAMGSRKVVKKTTSVVDMEDLVHKAWEVACELMDFAKREEEKKKKEHEEMTKQKEEERKKAKLTEEEKKRVEKREEEELRKHGDERMWAVIQGVWVEMLCFSAGRCRGYLHARSLAKGGEYLSYVWLLLSYMGMETMPERMQRPEVPVGGDTGALVKAPMEEEEIAEEQTRVRALVAQRPAATSAVAPIAGEHNV